MNIVQSCWNTFGEKYETFKPY